MMELGLQRDNGLIPKCAVSLDTESVQMYPGDYAKMAERSVFKEMGKIPLNPRKTPGVKSQLAFIMFGNGSTWNIILRFPYLCVPRIPGDGVPSNHYRVNFDKKPLDSGSKRILERLSQFSIAFGCDVLDDLNKIKDALWYLYKYPWNPPKALDIAALFVLAGYNENYHNMAVLSYLLLGVPMNKRVSEMDNMWAFSFTSLEERDPQLGALWYAYNDLKCGFNMMVVCFNWLFLEAFPDPLTVLTAIKTTEDKWRTMFILALAKTIGDRSLIFDTLKAAPMTRLGRILALSGASKKKPITSEEEALLHDLYDLFPCVPHG